MAEDGYMSESKVASASTRRSDEPARGKLKVKSVEILPTDNGGYIVYCRKEKAGSKDGFGEMVTKDYAFSSLDEVQDFERQELEPGAVGESTLGAAADRPASAPSAPPTAPAPSPAVASASTGGAGPSRPMNSSVYM